MVCTTMRCPVMELTTSSSPFATMMMRVVRTSCPRYGRVAYLARVSFAVCLSVCGLSVQDDEVDVAVTEAKTTISADDDDDKKVDAASKQKVTAVPAGTSGPASSFVHAPREVLSKYGALFGLWICIAPLTAHAEYG